MSAKRALVSGPEQEQPSAIALSRPGAGARLAGFGSILVRGALFAALWWVLTGADAASWLVGAPAVVAATWASLALAAPRRALSLRGVLRFLPYFLWASLAGGIDVARRVLRPRMPIEPGLCSYRMRLRDPLARVVFVDTISLLPGTLSADLCGDQVRVHALDARAAVDPELERLERRVAALFGERLADHRGDTRG